MSDLPSAQSAPAGAPAEPGVRAPHDIVEGILSDEPWAERALLAQYTPQVARVITRILGPHRDLEDLVQEVFLRAHVRMKELRDKQRLGPWLTSIAVFVARETLRKSRRWRWLLFLPDDALPERRVPPHDHEATAELRAFYEVLDTLHADTRIVLTLRLVEGMELSEIARILGVSLSTAKRRLREAEVVFIERAKHAVELSPWLLERSRWA